MAFWLTLVVSIVTAFMAVKIGFFEIFAAFCNALIAIYLALFLTPAAIALAPDAANIPGGIPLMTLALALAIFLFLYALCFFLITGQFSVPFPQFFDVLCAGGLGFILGFLVVSFLAVLLISPPTPYLSNTVSEIPIDSNTRFVCWWCDRVHRFVGTLDSPQPTREAIARIVDLAQSSQTRKPPSPINDVNSTLPPPGPQSLPIPSNEAMEQD
ncbi:hypothetical protein ACFL6U_27445 [Planctomycetota bacterium]